MGSPDAEPPPYQLAREMAPNETGRARDED
jgi:hypothetical protein